MRILLIEEFDNAPVPQALRCENIAFDMVPPPDEDEPFVSDELAAVLRALARRSPSIKSEILTAGDLTFDRGRCIVKSRSGEARLSSKETLLIDIFLSNPGQVVSRETIQARVWGSDNQSTYNSIEVYLTLLRRKLRSIGSEAQICAERGLGYYLAE